jgi:hypothetical protein
MPLLLAVLAQAAAASASAAEVWTNEEDVYLATEAKRAPPPWLALRLAGPEPAALDPFGKPAALPEGLAFRRNGEVLHATFTDGSVTRLRRARPATCWASMLKRTRKPDGAEDWTFHPGLKLHDQGGRVRAGGGDAPQAVLRMRNVVWPSGPNRPSLVLYVHTPDSPERAVSYAWADPGAARIGINLRWMQASCTIDGREPPSPALKEPKP